MVMTPAPPRRRRLGYLVWGIAVAVIAIPELYAAFAHEDVAWFTTISHMTGHLERHHEWVELLVVALIVLAVYSAVKVPPQKPSPEAAPADEAQDSSVDTGRTAGGRLTLRTDKQATPTDANKFDEEHASKWFVVAAIIILPAIALLTLAVVEWWPDKESSSPVVHYHASYVLYGLLGIFWVLVPTVVALVWGKDAFPTLFRTVNNGEEWVRPWSPRGVPVGAALAWVFAYAVLAGLVILLLHLTFYPYPSITKIINPNG